MNTLNYELSVRIATAIEAVLLDCWNNARRALLTCPEVAGASYIEGWAATSDQPGLVMEHGWLLLPSTETIDPSIVLDPTERETFYFPGLSFTQEEVRHLGAACPKAWDYGWHGLEHPAYLAAHKAAWEFTNGKPFPEYLERSIRASILMHRRAQNINETLFDLK